MTKTCDRFVASILVDLVNDIEDAKNSDEPAPTKRAAGVCKRLAELIGPAVGKHSDLKHAAFTKEDGGVYLVIQSPETKRRAVFVIDYKGRMNFILKVFAGMKCATIPVPSLDSPLVIKAVRWVCEEQAC